MKRLLQLAIFLIVCTGFVVGQSDSKLALNIRFAKTSYIINDKIEFEIARENVVTSRLLRRP